jgi:hypothetical protein
LGRPYVLVELIFEWQFEFRQEYFSCEGTEEFRLGSFGPRIEISITAAIAFRAIKTAAIAIASAALSRADCVSMEVNVNPSLTWQSTFATPLIQ